MAGVNCVEPEPTACLETAKELEWAAHAARLAYIRQARQLAWIRWYPQL